MKFKSISYQTKIGVNNLSSFVINNIGDDEFFVDKQNFHFKSFFKFKNLLR